MRHSSVGIRAYFFNLLFCRNGFSEAVALFFRCTVPRAVYYCRKDTHESSLHDERPVVWLRAPTVCMAGEELLFCTGVVWDGNGGFVSRRARVASRDVSLNGA